MNGHEIEALIDKMQADAIKLYEEYHRTEPDALRAVDNITTGELVMFRGGARKFILALEAQRKIDNTTASELVGD